MNTNRLHLARSADKPPHRDHARNQLLELRLSAGLSVAAIHLKDFLAARPNASLADCVPIARIVARYALAEVPGHVAVEDVQAILEQRGGRHE